MRGVSERLTKLGAIRFKVGANRAVAPGLARKAAQLFGGSMEALVLGLSSDLRDTFIHPHGMYSSYPILLHIHQPHTLEDLSSACARAVWISPFLPPTPEFPRV